MSPVRLGIWCDSYRNPCERNLVCICALFLVFLLQHRDPDLFSVLTCFQSLLNHKYQMAHSAFVYMWSRNLFFFFVFLLIRNMTYKPNQALYRSSRWFFLAVFQPVFGPYCWLTLPAVLLLTAGHFWYRDGLYLIFVFPVISGLHLC